MRLSNYAGGYQTLRASIAQSFHESHTPSNGHQNGAGGLLDGPGPSMSMSPF